MSTDPLIDRLAADLRPVRQQNPARSALILAVLCAIEIAILLLTGWMRPDMDHAMNMPSFWWKTSSLAVITAIGGATALLSLSPTHSPRRGVRALAYAIFGALAVGWLVDATQAGPTTLCLRLDPLHGVHCALSIIALSLPVALGLGLLVKRGASVDPRGTAWAAGIAAAGWGALAFVIVCRFDDPLYVVVWYMLGCGVVSLVTRMILPSLARW